MAGGGGGGGGGGGNPITLTVSSLSDKKKFWGRWGGTGGGGAGHCNQNNRLCQMR